MTIVESVKTVLADGKSLTIKEIYSQILEENLFKFGAKNPIGVLGSQIRRHCRGLNAPSYNTSAVKYFKISSNNNGVIKYSLIDKDESALKTQKTDLSSLPQKDLSFEEQIAAMYSRYLEQVAKNLLEKIIDNSSDFFEELTVKLLLSMGYGYDDEAGIVTGRSHDGGIDGIIYADKFGLETIYLQAKRYSNGNNVGTKDIQAFIGAMDQIHKGVFITTSSFTKEALAFAKKQSSKRLKLIAGNELTKLMIENQVGVIRKNIFMTYNIDDEYFTEI